MAAMRRPQFGSQPAQAVLTSGRMGDGFGDTKGIGVGGCTVDAKFDDVRNAFAVGDDLTREGGADLRECGREFRVVRIQCGRRWHRTRAGGRCRWSRCRRRRRCG